MNVKLGRLGSDGVFDLISPKTSASLLNFATEPCGDDLVREGRRFTLDWTARAAMRALTGALEQRPAAGVELTAAAELASYLQRQTRWTRRLADRYGARAVIASDATMQGRSFHVSP